MFIDIVIFENKIMKVLYIYIYISIIYIVSYFIRIMLEMRIRCIYMRACIYISSVEYVHKNILYIKQIKQKKRKRKETFSPGWGYQLGLKGAATFAWLEGF